MLFDEGLIKSVHYGASTVAMRSTVQPTDRQFLKRQKGVKAKIAALAFTLDKPLLSLLQCHISVFPRACCRVELWLFTLLHTGLFVLKLLNNIHVLLLPFGSFGSVILEPAFRRAVFS